MIPRSAFRSNAFPEDERAAAYGNLVGGLGRMTPLSSPFHAAFVAYAVGPMRFHDVHAVPHLFERSASKIAMDGLELFLVQHLVKGRAEITLEGRTVEAGEGSVFAISFSQPSMIREIGDVHLHLLTMSRRIGEEALGDLGALHGRVLTPPRATPYADHFNRVLPRLDGLAKSDAPRVVQETLDVLARVFGVRGATSAGRLDRTKDRLRVYIEQHLSSRDLTPETISRTQRLSRSRLYELFESDGGVFKYIWHRRLELVLAALHDATDQRSLAELAYAHGFSNQAHLSTLFRKTFDETPSGVRRNRA